MLEPMQPAIFVCHGSPEELGLRWDWQLSLEMLGRLVKPKAYILMSAHWTTTDSFDIGFQDPFTTIHDFSGFSKDLYQFSFPASGNLQVAKDCMELIQRAGLKSNLVEDRGLDHGAYVPLRFMDPQHKIPVISVSIPKRARPPEIFRMGELLAPLRREGCMILGSGGMVHNLRALAWDHRESRNPEPWAQNFKDWVIQTLKSRNWEQLCSFKELAPDALMAHPTWEHFAPLLFVAGAASAQTEDFREIFDSWTYDNLSMSTVGFGVPIYQ